jgi:hypothetical protein
MCSYSPDERAVSTTKLWRLGQGPGEPTASEPHKVPVKHQIGTYHSRKRRMTFAVILDTFSLTGSERAELIEPAENTTPPRAP